MLFRSPDTTESYTDTGLDNGTTYYYIAFAITEAGRGSESAPANGRTFDVPGAPTSLAATSYRGGHVPLTWSPPNADGGTPVTDYTVQYRVEGAAEWLTFNDGPSANTGATVTGLDDGTVYEFQVIAVNPVGPGAPSLPTTGKPAFIPTPPVVITEAVSFLDSRVTLTWTEPTNNGGDDIFDYIVEFRVQDPQGEWIVFDDGVGTPDAKVIDLTTTVTELTNGVTYDFRVTAENRAGTGPSSTPVDAKPATTPGAPTTLSADRDDGQVTLTWALPTNNGGDTVFDYTIQYKLSSVATWTD